MKKTNSTKRNLPNGVILDLEGGWAKSLTEYAHKKGFPKVFAFLAEHPDGSKEYLLVDYTTKGGKAIYANPSFEAVSCHIDMMSLESNWD